MRQSRPEFYSSKRNHLHPEDIDLSGVVPLKPNPYGTSAPAFDQSNKPNGQTERSNRTVEPNGRTVLDELKHGVSTAVPRQTRRYSFEIYIDQIEYIEEVQELYKKRTGKKLPASRLIREALDKYFENVLSR